ncbi:MAG: proton-conducting membrane transporter [Acidimicrobiia bacterium]
MNGTNPFLVTTFIAVAAVMLWSAIGVVTVRNVVHAALYLVLTLGSTAVLYVILAAEFIAWVQVLVYVGAIVVLFLFGIMLTHAPIGKSQFLTNNKMVLYGILAAAIFGGVMLYTIGAAFGRSQLFTPVQQGAGIAQVGSDLMTTWVVPFEAVSMVLLAALIGALAVARKD